MKIALYKNVGSSFEWTTVVQQTMLDSKGVYLPEYVRATDWIDVEFPPLPRAVVVQSQLNALSDAETELRMKFQTKLDQIETERSKLLSLTHDAQS